MKTYEVTISDSFVVDAEDESDAENIAVEMFDFGSCNIETTEEE